MRECASGLQLLLNQCISLKRGPKFMHGISKRKGLPGNRNVMKFAFYSKVTDFCEGIERVGLHHSLKRL